MPKQLLGPLLNATSQLSKPLASGLSHRSGLNLKGSANISGELCTNVAKMPTIVPPGTLTDEMVAPPGGTTRRRGDATPGVMRRDSFITAVRYGSFSRSSKRGGDAR